MAPIDAVRPLTGLDKEGEAAGGVGSGRGIRVWGDSPSASVATNTAIAGKFVPSSLMCRSR